MDRKLNGRGVLNQLRKLTFPGAGPTVVSPPGDEGTHGKRDKGLTPPLKDRDIYLVARLKTPQMRRATRRLPVMASVLF